MSPRTPKQNKILKVKKEAQIIEAALGQFSEHGFTGTSMQSVAKQAGVSKGNLYNYFVSKDELLEKVLQKGLELIMQPYARYEFIENETVFQQIIRDNFELLQRNKIFWKLYYNLVAQPKVRDLFLKVFQPFYLRYMQLFQAYFEKKGEKDPEATALLLGSTLDGISLGYIVMGELYPLEQVMDQLIEKFK